MMGGQGGVVDETCSDVVVNSSLEGAMCVLVRNRKVDGTYQPVPPLTVQEAAVYCLARSTGAWSKKETVGTSAYRVHACALALDPAVIRNQKYYLEGDLKTERAQNWLPEVPNDSA